MTHTQLLRRTQSLCHDAEDVACLCHIDFLGSYFHIGPVGLVRLYRSRLVPIAVWFCPGCDLVHEVAPFDMTLPLDYDKHPCLWIVPTRIAAYPYSTAYRPGRAKP